MKKVIGIIHTVLAVVLLLLAYIPESVRNTGIYLSGVFYDGYELSFGSEMGGFGFVMIGTLILLIALGFTKFYYLTIAPAVINLFLIVYVYFDIDDIRNVYISDDFIVILIIIVAICVLLNSIWALMDYVLEKRKNESTNTVIKQVIPQSNADELRKYKELLDINIITPEEFEAKKKQLLNL